jgi:Fe-S-cluster containining protein
MIPENEEALWKKGVRIQRLEDLEVFGEILSYYGCPERCNGTCCRILDIPVEESDIERIGRANPRNKLILETLVQPDETFTYWGNTVNADKTFPEKPCPFLSCRTSLCKIHKIKPDSCKIYPFLTKPNDEPENPIKYELALCLMGLDISIDYCFWSLMAFRDAITSKDIEVFLESLSINLLTDKTKLENIKTAKFPNFDILKAFLFYLNTEDAVNRVQRREHFKLNMKKELLKFLRENKEKIQ